MSPRPPANGPARPRRTPGRPTRDSADQRAHLLDSAIECFVAQGIAATSLRAIAGRAHVTPALLWTGLKWALAIGFIGGLFPAVRAARLPVTTALRES